MRQCCTLAEGNPEPFWIAAKKGDALPSRIVKADNGAMDGATYFGRSFQSTTCHVTSTNSQCGNSVAVSGEAMESGALLQTNGYQWLPALCGDSVPPNAVILGVSESDGSQYLGRV